MESFLSFLSELESYPYFEYWLPAALILGAGIASRLLGLSLWAVLLSACLPLFAAHMDLPIADELENRHPLLIMGVGWLALIAVGTGLSLARAIARLVHPGSASPSLLSVGGLVASTALVAMLFLAPDALEKTLPGWQGTLGVLILLFALVSFTVSLARLARAGALVVFWAAICLVLASEIFLRKLPNEMLALDLRDLGLAEHSPFRALGAGAESGGSDVIDVAILSGRSAPSGSGAIGYPALLEAMLNWEGRRFRVIDTPVENGGILEMRAALASRALPAEPEVVVISGWYVDGLHARAEGDPLRDIPVLSALARTRLYRAVSYMLEEAGERAPDGKLGLSPVDYKAILREMVKEVKRAGALPVLFHQSVEESASLPLEREYEKAVQDVAREERALYADVSAELHRRRRDPLFSRADLLTKAGNDLIARGLYRSIVAAKDMGSAHLANGLAGLPSRPFREVSFVAKAEDLENDLSLKVRSALSLAPFRLLFTVNDRLVAQREPDEDGRVMIKLPKEALTAPAVEVSLRAVPSDAFAEDEVGSTDVATPVPLEIKTSGDGLVADAAIRVPGARLEPDGDRIATLMALDPKTGSIIRARRYTAEGLDEMADVMMAIRTGSVVAISIDKPLPAAPGEALKRALRYVGAERFPDVGDEMALIGAAGAVPGSAMIKAGKGPQELKLGSEKLKQLSDLEIEEAKAGDKRII